MIKKEFIEKLKKELSEENFNLYLKSLNENETHGFTLNLDKLKKSSIDLGYIKDRYKAKVIFENKNYVYLTYDKDELSKGGIFPGKDPLYHVGLYYIQEPCAASVLFDVDFKSSDAVLDLCASPGGKSCEALYNLKTENGGFLISNEINYSRAKILSSNIERMGFENVIVTCDTPSKLSDKFFGYFDKVIVDAPCSGEGMFRKSEEARNQWSEALVSSCARMQKEIIDEAIKMLKTGGILVYSTCTFSKEEDEDNVDYILNKYNDVKLIKIKKEFPFNSIGEGQFYAILMKGEPIDIVYNRFPSKMDLNGLNILRYKIDAYENVKGRDVPTHASSHNDDFTFKHSIDLSDDEIIKYLHGDVIRKDINFNDWTKITYKNLGVGLGKVVNGVIKNHYPKGLRNF